MEEEMITTFTTTELNGQVRENLFSFTPPPDAKLIQNFPDPAKEFANVNLTGEPAPSLKLKSEDGSWLSSTHSGQAVPPVRAKTNNQRPITISDSFY
jgi:hypothetical protein